LIAKYFVGADQEETEYKQAYKMVEENKIIDGMTIAALFLARKRLLKLN
jgi:hypothetical protein